MKLYELPESYAKIQALLDETNGEITPEIEAILNEADKLLEQKIDNICALLRTMHAEEEAFAKEAEHFRKKAQAAANKSKNLRSYLLHCMDKLGLTKANGTRFKVSVCRSAIPSIKWTRLPEEAPPEMQRHTVEVDYVKAKAALSKHGSLPEGFVVEYGRHVRTY